MNELKMYVERVGLLTFAARMGYSEAAVRHVLNGRRGVSKKFAEKAEAASGGFLRKETLLWGDRP